MTQQMALSDMLYHFRSIDAIKGGKGGNGELRQQLTHSYALVAAVGGEAQLLVDYEQVELRRGSLYFVKPGQTIGAGELSGDAELYLIGFDIYTAPKEPGCAAAAIRDIQPPQGGKRWTIQPADKLAELCDELYRTYGSGDGWSALKCQGDFLHLLHYACGSAGRLKPDGSYYALEYAKQYIEEHYSEALSIDMLAQKAGLSPKYFVDLFKKKYGRSAMDYAAELRLTEAKRLIAQGDLLLKDIANRVGYSDEFYFSRKFKKEIGVSPRVYMKSRMQKLVAYSPAILGFLLPLGVLPYAAPLHPKWTEHYYREYRGDIPVHTSAFRHNQDWERNIARLQPVAADMIIASDEIQEAEKCALELAPEVCYVPAEWDWRAQLLLIAERLGESWQAERWLAQYDAAADACRDKLSPDVKERKAVGVRLVEDRLYLHCNRSMAHVLFEKLALNNGYSGEGGTYNEPVTPEQLAALNPGLILLLVRQDSETLDTWKRLQSDPAWLSIEAVHRNEVYMITSDPWREYSAHAHFRMLKQAEELFSEKHP